VADLKNLDMRATLKSLKEIGEKLGLATDDLNEALEQAEAVIHSYKLGVSAFVTVRIEGEIHHMVGFGKKGEEWQLLFYKGPLPKEPDRIVPLLSASRAARLRSAHYLPELFSALLREAEEQISIIREATDTVLKFVKGLKGGV
jgi:hypothetical protein